jgi:quercetin dioxygenase-like cupin family protein
MDNDIQTTQLIYQLDQLLPIPEFGKRNQLLLDDENHKIILFAFAAETGLAEHVAPLPAFIQVLQGEALITVGDVSVSSKPGTFIRMDKGTPHSIQALTPVLMMLILVKG